MLTQSARKNFNNRRRGLFSKCYQIHRLFDAKVSLALECEGRHFAFRTVPGEQQVRLDELVLEEDLLPSDFQTARQADEDAVARFVPPDVLPPFPESQPRFDSLQANHPDGTGTTPSFDDLQANHQDATDAPHMTTSSSPLGDFYLFNSTPQQQHVSDLSQAGDAHNIKSSSQTNTARKGNSRRRRNIHRNTPMQHNLRAGPRNQKPNYMFSC